MPNPLKFKNLSRKTHVRSALALMMTCTLVALMSYKRIGEATHEILGVLMIALVCFHCTLNLQWLKSAFKTRPKPSKILSLGINLASLICLIGLLSSAFFISKYVFGFLGLHNGASTARTVHLLAAYWGFMFICLHIGFHIDTLTKMTSSMFKRNGIFMKFCFKAMLFATAIYGAYAFYKRDIGVYMFLRNEFAFFDFGENLALFFADHIAMMTSFALCDYLIQKLLKRLDALSYLP